MRPIYIHTHTYTYIYIYIYIYIHPYIHRHIHTYIYTYIYIHIHTDVPGRPWMWFQTTACRANSQPCSSAPDTHSRPARRGEWCRTRWFRKSRRLSMGTRTLRWGSQEDALRFLPVHVRSCYSHVMHVYVFTCTHAHVGFDGGTQTLREGSRGDVLRSPPLHLDILYICTHYAHIKYLDVLYI